MKVLVQVLIVVLISSLIFYVVFKRTNYLGSRSRDCVPAAWTENDKFGECSRDCEGGLQYATRSVLQEASNGGRQCDPYSLIRSRSCNDGIACGQRCIPGNPNLVPWNPCPECVTANAFPTEWKMVPPFRAPTYMGEDCRLEDVFFYRSCSEFIPQCPIDQDCVLTPYLTSSCNVVCGSGTQNVYSSISEFSSGNGAQCNYGELIVQQTCYPGACPTECDSLFSNSVPSQCNASCGPGVQILLRDPESGFQECPYIKTQSCTLAECPDDTCVAAPVDFIEALCYLSCSQLELPDTEGICTSSEIFAAVCSGIFGTDGCQEPQDCSLSDWSTFSECSVPVCDPAYPVQGIQTRVRTIVENANAGGIPCTDPSLVKIDTRPCNTFVPVSYSAWVNGQVIQTVSDATCVDRPCEYSAFYIVQPCNATCQGAGVITYNRSITQFPDSPLTQDQCSTNPLFYVSYSNCLSNTPCRSCEWSNGASLGLYCDWYAIQNGITLFSASAPLVSNTNIPGDTCQRTAICTLNNTSLFDPLSNQTFQPGLRNGIWNTHSCTGYVIDCRGANSGCPQGCNGLVCNGTGVPISSPGAEVCTCSCFVGWTGNNCATQTFACPISSLTGLICNGYGSCTETSPGVGTCECASGDTTPDCSNSYPYCWVYGEVQVGQSGNDFFKIKKLLGALPIGSLGATGESWCLSLTTYGAIDLEPDQEFRTYFPTPMQWSFGRIPSNVYGVESARFTGILRSNLPRFTKVNSPFSGESLFQSDFIQYLTESVAAYDTSNFAYQNFIYLTNQGVVPFEYADGGVLLTETDYNSVQLFEQVLFTGANLSSVTVF